VLYKTIYLHFLYTLYTFLPFSQNLNVYTRAQFVITRNKYHLGISMRDTTCLYLLYNIYIYMYAYNDKNNKEIIQWLHNVSSR